LKRLHDLSPSDVEVMEQLSALYVELRDYRGMVQLYEDQILRGKDPSTRAELARKVARLWESELDDPREAADAWRRVLRMKAGDPEATEGLERAKSNMLKRKAEPDLEASRPVGEAPPQPEAAAPAAPLPTPAAVEAPPPRSTPTAAADPELSAAPTPSPPFEAEAPTERSSPPDEFVSAAPTGVVESNVAAAPLENGVEPKPAALEAPPASAWSEPAPAEFDVALDGTPSAPVAATPSTPAALDDLGPAQRRGPPAKPKKGAQAAPPPPPVPATASRPGGVPPAPSSMRPPPPPGSRARGQTPPPPPIGTRPPPPPPPGTRGGRPGARGMAGTGLSGEDEELAVDDEELIDDSPA
jgi:hypothetical protein